MQFSAELTILNGGEPFNSTASGSANLTLEAPSENTRTLRVQIDATGLEDLSGIGGIHVAHIHGQFARNASQPLLEQGDGTFFDGEGGDSVNSILPTIANSDIDGDGYVNFLEGRPNYGPVVLNLTSTQIEAAPEGTPPLTHFLNLATAGEINPAELFPSGTEFNLDTTYTFDLTDPDQLRQFNNLSPLNEREIVIHGLTIPLEISEAIDAVAMGAAPAGVDLDNGEAFRITAPVAAGTIDAVIPEVAANSQFIGLTDHNTLIAFDPNDPTQTDSVAVTGLEGDLIGIDTRPANGLVYGITTADNIYTIDPDSGAATFVSTLNQAFEATTVSGFDFNPVADRLRLVGDNDQDFRINVDTGEVTVDGTLTYGTGDDNEGTDPSVTAAAYTNSFDGTTATQLYDIDEQLDILVLQNPPNDGILMTIGELGVDFDTVAGFEIVSSSDGENAAFAVSNDTFYTIDLDTGAAISLGTIGSDSGVDLLGLTAISNAPDDPGIVPVFGTVDGDVIEVEGGNQLIFAGDADDLIDASIGSDGGNRIYAGSGDDIAILGTGDRIVGGEGADQLYATSGGNNTITGGAGADQFWIAVAEIPDAANIITDFTSGEDVIGIAGLGIGFDNLTITDTNDGTLIAANGLDLAIVNNVNADLITNETNFAFA